MKYLSSSKGEVEIAEMATPHIANGWRKLGGTLAAMEDGSELVVAGKRESKAHVQAVHQAMEDELLARGCTWNAELGNWNFPEAKP